MCKWGTSEKLEVKIPQHLSRTGKERLKVVDIDSCIYSIVKALNDGGVTTIASCCGHGHTRRSPRSRNHREGNGSRDPAGILLWLGQPCC